MTITHDVLEPRSGKSSGHDMFKLVHFEARTVGKRAVGILLEWFLACVFFDHKKHLVQRWFVLLKASGSQEQPHGGGAKPPHSL